MTVEQLTAGLRHVGGVRRCEERLSHAGVPYAVWTHADYWFAAVEGDDGCAVAADRDSAVAMAVEHIDSMPDDDD